MYYIGYAVYFLEIIVSDVVGSNRGSSKVIVSVLFTKNDMKNTISKFIKNNQWTLFPLNQFQFPESYGHV